MLVADELARKYSLQELIAGAKSRRPNGARKDNPVEQFNASCYLQITLAISQHIESLEENGITIIYAPLCATNFQILEQTLAVQLAKKASLLKEDILPQERTQLENSLNTPIYREDVINFKKLCDEIECNLSNNTKPAIACLPEEPSPALTTAFQNLRDSDSSLTTSTVSTVVKENTTELKTGCR